jgi:hypothetical protein
LITRHAWTVATIASIVGAVSLMAAVAGYQNGPPTATGLYHPDPQHLWNRLHRHLHVRTTADGREFGLDEVDPLLWDETRYLLSGPSHARALRLLDEFLNMGGERLITDPLKRAVLQHDLWNIFDWAVERRYDGRDARQREALSTRLARGIRRLALTREQIDRLPDTYADAVRADPSLPADLLGSGGNWLPVGGLAPIARQHASGLSRSAFSVHWNVPGGTEATAAYLKKLWEFPAPFVADLSVDGELRAALNPALPAVPNGTRLALVRTMLLVDQTGTIVPTKVVESIQFHVIGPVHAFSEHNMRRARLFAGQAGGLRAVEPTDRSFLTFSAKGDDVFEQGGRGPSGEVTEVTLSFCDMCHQSRFVSGVASVLSVRSLLKPETLVDSRHPRWAQWFPQAAAAVAAKNARMDFGVLRGIWQSVPQ